MKILAISCSPSRGRNSDTMLDSFILGMREVSGIEVEKIYLEDVHINSYRFENSKDPEEGEKDFKKLVSKIANDISGLVIATPTYNFSVPAHLKNFIDRIRFIALDLTQRNKFGQPVGKLHNLKTYFLVSGGTPNWAEHILFFAFPAFWLRALFLYFGAKVMGAFYSGDIRTFENKKILDKCFKKGKKYAIRVLKGNSQGMLENIFFRPPTRD
ncbi:MAG: NAD(P)H-dependent oxidoreductase [Burkholderiales bacterium]|nr:NAD(P)H-dependent oxidoreductase [Burkholderiales bacterium]